jgi:predicted ester cyclase
MMMKAVIVLAMALVAVSTAAADSTNPKAEALLWYDAFDGNKPTLLDKIIDPAWVDIPSPPSDQTGPAAAKQLLSGLHASFPDFAIKVEDVLQDGDKVVVRSTISATLRGFPGFPPTGRSMKIQAVDIHEFKNGKIIRTWHTEDWMTGLRELGLMREPTRP